MPRPPKALIDKWYAKLEKSGFKDIEESEDRMEVWASTNFQRFRKRRTEFEGIQDYYVLAGRFLHDYKFESKKDRAIWELHAEGLGYREIAKQLKSRNFRVYRDLVNETVVRLRTEMLKHVE